VTYKVSFPAFVVNRDDWLAISVVDSEWKALHITLNILVIEFSANQSLHVEDGVCRI
jgi:hypothetical protein